VSDKTRAYSYVAVQFLLLFVLFTAPRSPQPYGLLSELLSLVGLVVMGAGFLVLAISFFRLGASLTASPIPKDQGQLVTSGLYSRVRHPIYFGLLLLGIGVVLDAGWWPQLVVLTMLYLLLRIKSDFEETMLRKKYPEYSEYAARTPRFFPRIGK
jgi:protein-S-isoprenylcysteine O-methyltransferase Ste14